MRRRPTVAPATKQDKEIMLRVAARLGMHPWQYRYNIRTAERIDAISIRRRNEEQT